MRYFAYGTNCNPKVLARKQVRFRSRRRATLVGYRLKFDKKALRERLPEDVGFANIEQAPGGEVEGVLYDLQDGDIGGLDDAERCPDHYERLDVSVATESGAVSCFTYKARPDKTAEGLKPSRNYLNHILAANDFLSSSYFEALDRCHTYEGPCAVCGATSEVVFIRQADRIHMLCQPCREARSVWGGARGRALTIEETAAVMQVVRERGGFASIRELLDEVVSSRIIDP